MGASQSSVESASSASAFLTQQFSSSCDVSCQNIISGVNETLVNTIVGGSLTFNQTCSANGTCLSGNAMDATANVMLKAANSTNAKNANNLFTGSILNFDSSDIDSRMNIKESINQSANETCNVSSYNQMNDISIFALNSEIDGDIAFNQTGSAVGQCQLNNNMTAAAYATGLMQNQAASGKDKKGQKFGEKSGKTQVLLYAIIGIVVVVIVVIVGKAISGGSSKKEKKKQEEAAFEAMVAAGCGEGREILKDLKTGKPIKNPQTGRPMCTPTGAVAQPEGGGAEVEPMSVPVPPAEGVLPPEVIDVS